jgi:predicted aldo/keto reductase-like oxidoreductase
VDIPAVIRLLGMAERGMTPAIKAAYAALPVKASDCTECAICADRCPFDVDITAKMRQAVDVFGF